MKKKVKYTSKQLNTMIDNHIYILLKQRIDTGTDLQIYNQTNRQITSGLFTNTEGEKVNLERACRCLLVECYNMASDFTYLLWQ